MSLSLPWDSLDRLFCQPFLLFINMKAKKFLLPDGIEWDQKMNKD